MRTFPYKGKWITIDDMCKMNGLSRRANEKRVQRGMPIDEICETRSLVRRSRDFSDCEYPDCFHCSKPDCVKG